MKKILLGMIVPVLFCATACEDIIYPDRHSSKGYLEFTEGLQVDEIVAEVTKASNFSVDNFHVFIYDNQNAEVLHTTWGEIEKQGRRVLLDVGSYTVVVRSTEEEVPMVSFENPVYGCSRSFKILANEATTVADLICNLLQTMVTVSFAPEFLDIVAGDGSLNVSIIDGYSLDFDLTYNEGDIKWDTRKGYLAVDETVNTMVVRYSGFIKDESSEEAEPKLMNMVKTFENIKAAEWHKLVFQKKLSQEGNADFTITVEGFLDDGELGGTVVAPEEDTTGKDPKTPSGDGGIELISTCSYDLNQPIVVPELENEFVLTMTASVPNKVNKFVVDIESTNPNFPDAVALINDGNTTLDLVNPSEGAIQVFTTILPFPYGKNVKNQELINFNLSDAQAPILGFEGTHKFIMTVTDNKGCKKSIAVTLVVE